MPLGGADDAKVDSWWLFETWIFFLCIYSVKGGDDYLITSWANAKGDAKADQQSRDKQSTFLIPSFFYRLEGKNTNRGVNTCLAGVYTHIYLNAHVCRNAAWSRQRTNDATGGVSMQPTGSSVRHELVLFKI